MAALELVEKAVTSGSRMSLKNWAGLKSVHTLMKTDIVPNRWISRMPMQEMTKSPSAKRISTPIFTITL